MSPLRTAIVGCGNIATRYAQQILTYPELQLVGFSDIDAERAEKFAAEFGGRAYASLDEVLADPGVDLVVNLTIHHAHYEVIKQCLEAGKHVHTEKPFALSGADARFLVELAESRGVRLSSAPITYMGEAQQAAWELVRGGRIGTPRLVYAEVNHGRIETWHPNPEPFYQVGVMWDVGLYPLTLMTAILGPVRRVSGQTRLLYPDRVTKEGRPFSIETPDCYFAVLDFASGATARLTANFYVGNSRQGGALEFHGDTGTVYLGNFQSFSAEVEFSEFGSRDRYAATPARPPYDGIEFGRGVQDLAQAIHEGRPQRADARHATHVIEVLEAIEVSAREGRAVEVTSQFPAPWPMDWSAMPELTLRA